MEATLAGLETATYRGFACPQEALDERFLEAVSVEYARGYARLFLDRWSRELENRSRGLVPHLASWLEQPLTFESVWNVSFGQVRRAVLDYDASRLTRLAAALGLDIMRGGQGGEWELELESPARFRWDRWLLPACRAIEVSADASGATIKIRRGRRPQRVRFRRSASGWQPQGAEVLPAVRAVGQRYVLIPAATLETFPLGGVRAIWPAAEKTAMTRALHGAVRLLARHAPIFLPWVGRVLRGVVPVAAKPSMIHSGGDQDHPGVVYLSFGCPPAALAEMLVHEGTHQYYHLLTCLGPLEDGSDSTLYYSPIKRTGRQIGMILLAYHAFANVLLFYRLCRRNGFEHDGYIRHNEDALVPQLDQLEAALRTTRALTPLGRALWEPLAERIR